MSDRPEMREHLRSGGLLFVGAYDPKRMLEASMNGAHTFSTDSAFVMDLPNEAMAYCVLYFAHYLPRSHPTPPSHEEITAWVRRLWATVSPPVVHPTFSREFHEDTKVLQLVLEWTQEVMSSVPLALARDLEQSVVANGGRMSDDDGAPAQPGAAMLDHTPTPAIVPPEIPPSVSPGPVGTWHCGHPREAGTTRCWDDACRGREYNPETPTGAPRRRTFARIALISLIAIVLWLLIARSS